MWAEPFMFCSYNSAFWHLRVGSRNPPAFEFSLTGTILLSFVHGSMAPSGPHFCFNFQRPDAPVWQLAPSSFFISFSSLTRLQPYLSVPRNPRIPTFALPTRVRIWSSTSPQPHIWRPIIHSIFDIIRAPLQEFKGVVQLGSRRDLSCTCTRTRTHGVYTWCEINLSGRSPLQTTWEGGGFNLSVGFNLVIICFKVR